MTRGQTGIIVKLAIQNHVKISPDIEEHNKDVLVKAVVDRHGFERMGGFPFQSSERLFRMSSSLFRVIPGRFSVNINW